MNVIRNVKLCGQLINAGRVVCHYQNHFHGIINLYKHIHVWGCFLEVWAMGLSITTMNHISTGVKRRLACHLHCDCLMLGVATLHILLSGATTSVLCKSSMQPCYDNPDSKVHEAYMGPTWGRQDPGGPHVGPRNLAIRESGKWLVLFLEKGIATLFIGNIVTEASQTTRRPHWPLGDLNVILKM